MKRNNYETEIAGMGEFGAAGMGEFGAAGACASGAGGMLGAGAAGAIPETPSLQRSARNWRKPATMIAALAIVAALGAGGTWAYFSAQTDTTVNTFAAGADVAKSITLDESAITYNKTSGTYSKNSDTRVTENKDYVIVPGVAMPKDPVVTVETDANSTASYVFVKVDAGEGWTQATKANGYTFAVGDMKDALSFAVADEWTYVTTDDGDAVFVQKLAGDTTGATKTTVFPIIKSNEVAVNSGLDATTIGQLDASKADLDFTAYIVQQGGFEDALAAWTATFGA